jgi:hypothetical protein
MEMQDLMQKASEAIASLWLFQLSTISTSTGVEMSVLYNCLNLQVPQVPPVPVPTVPEKKKRAPPKKKEAVVVAPTATADDGEAPAEAPAEAPPAEKKKRAPAKKKEAVVVVDVAPTATADDGEVATEVPPPAEKKKRAPPKKKEAVVVVDVAPPPTTDDDWGGDKYISIDELLKSNKLTKFKGPAEKKKRAPAKKKEAVVVDFASDDDEVATEVPPPTEAPPAEKKRAPAKKKEATKKTKTNMKINDDEEVSCSGNTVIMPPDRIDVEEVFIGATSFLVAENNTAYLKSSRQPVGKYDPEQKTIHPHIDDEDDEEDDERDECPVLSDMSDDE